MNISAINGEAIGISASGKYNKIEIDGDTTIVVNGGRGTYALYAENGGKITVGSIDKTVSLTGDVATDGGSVTNHGYVTINGSLAVKNLGTYTSTGDKLMVKAGSEPALTVADSGNKLDFNAANTEFISVGDSYIYAVNIAANNKENTSTTANMINFNGDTTKITATATDGKHKV